MSVTGSKVPRDWNSTVVPTASPTANPNRHPAYRSRSDVTATPVLQWPGPPPLQPQRQPRRPEHKMQHPPLAKRRGLRRGMQNWRPHHQRSAPADWHHDFAMLQTKCLRPFAIDSALRMRPWNHAQSPALHWTIIYVNTHRDQLLEHTDGRLHIHLPLLLRPSRTLQTLHPTLYRNAQILMQRHP